MDRIFIVGNGGSGKSWLAEELAAKLRLPLTHLDDLHWLPGFAGERPRHERDQLVAEAADGASWIMEGIYGSILKQVFSRVTTLIWLDVADDECISNLMRRGQTDGGTPEQFEELLEYTRGYRLRKNHLNSFEGHQWFFGQHPNQKYRLSNRSEVTDFLAGLR
ncbi:AAA family ATPase [Rhizobium sullae]|uniref:Adenylate kinase family enzyme n=1 Tax=Rhizobium sullae TaxID=50338 RepID=A0A4R3PW17_RHISU|nr:AAA family ATPase [Rhizobium sullae]TCU11214.1 adenylate kinase family enzyme [Rhizobium sullae]